MEISSLKIGLAVTGSFCTLSTILDYIRELSQNAAYVVPVFAESVMRMDTRFSPADEITELIEKITGNTGIKTIQQAERIGPEKMFDILAVIPCTGNTVAKIALGITDTVVTMAVKSHLRNSRPVVIGASSNDLLGANAKNLGALLNFKNIYFVPLFQDDALNKEKSLSFKPELICKTISKAAEGKQLQPLFAF
jgi:dipicolinate synthase subunit B